MTKESEVTIIRVDSWELVFPKERSLECILFPILIDSSIALAECQSQSQPVGGLQTE